MKILRAFEAQYSGIYHLNSDDGDFMARVYAVLAVASQLMPVAYKLTIDKEINNYGLVVVDAILCIALTLFLIDRRRNRIKKIIIRMSDTAAKFTLAFFLVFPILLFSYLSLMPYYYVVFALVLFSICPIDRILVRLSSGKGGKEIVKTSG